MQKTCVLFFYFIVFTWKFANFSEFRLVFRIGRQHFFHCFYSLSSAAIAVQEKTNHQKKENKNKKERKPNKKQKHKKYLPAYFAAQC